MSTRGKLRPARLAAMDAQWGDLLLTQSSTGMRVVGTVLDSRTENCWCIFRVRTPGGEVIETKPVAEEKPVWVHVPAGTA